MIIYICAFKNMDYIEEAKVCIESIKTKGKFKGTIYLFTDMDVSIENVSVIKTQVDSVPLSASYRLRFFEHIKLDDIPSNEIVMYLDTDIVALKEIPSFDNINDKINVYGYPDRTQEGVSFAGHITNDKQFTEKTAICSGILLFKPSQKVKEVFDDAYNLYVNLIQKRRVHACWEQPALCYTMTKFDMCEVSLNDYVYEERSNYVNENATFNHFCAFRGKDRYIKMKNLLES